jgi:ribokinase
MFSHSSPPVSAGDGRRIVVVGDSLLDVVVHARALVPGGDRPAAIQIAPGGQAANVAVRLARRGAIVRLVAAMADDPAGRLLAAQLAAEGIELDGLPGARTGAVIALVDRAGERTMLSDRVPLASEPASLVEALRPRLAGASWIHVSGYALLDPNLGEGLAAAMRDATARVSADGGSVHSGAQSAERLASRLRDARPDLLFASRPEAEALIRRAPTDEPPRDGGDPRGELAELAAALREHLELKVVIVTGGPAGSAAAVADRRGHPTIRAVPVRRALDTTGAGDAYAAGVIAALVGQDRWPPATDTLRRAMHAGADLAGRVVRVGGAQGRVSGEPSGGGARR